MELPEKEEKEPLGQGVHVPDLACEIHPAGQEEQVSLPLPLAYWPCRHAVQDEAPTKRLAVALAQGKQVPPTLGL